MRKLFTLFFLSLVSFTISAQNEPGTAPLNPEFINYFDQKNSEKHATLTEEGYALGIVPSPAVPVLKPVKHMQDKSFAESYDLRDQGGVSTVKNQGNCGSCWTFSTMGAIESRWLIQGYGEFDLSEDNLNNCHPYDWAPCEGGNLNISASMLAAGKGPLNETDDPYSGIDDNTCPSGLTSVAYVSDIWWVDTSRTSIKQALTDYGALYVSMYWFSDAYNSSNDTYYYTGSGDGSDGGGGHGVTLVGWDDNKVTDASQPGAWIIKNSWGDSWGESGYFYISYYDTEAFSSVGVFPNRMDYNADAQIYGYDEAGWVSSNGWSDGEDVALVKFTASEDQTLEKIGTYSVASNSTLDIEIYNNFDGTTLSNKLGELTNQTCAYAGYHTFELGTSIDLTAGDDFYIKITYNTNTNWPIPVEKQYTDYTSTPIELSGKCWISSDGTSWMAVGNDITDKEFDLAIKAYAVNKSGSSPSEDSGPFAWLHPKPQGNNIYGSHFLNESMGFVCGASGTVMKTTDGGSSWAIMSADTLTSLYGIHFLTEDTGFVSGYGFIKRTVDGGTTWSYMEESEGDPINDIAFIDDTTGIAVVNYGTILRTVDKGETWEIISTGSSSSLYDVLFLTSAKGFAVGTSGAILTTTDSGKTWTESTYGTETFNKIFFLDDNTGFVVGDNGTLYKTTDGGSGWTTSANGISEFYDLDDVYFEDANTGLAVGEDYIYKTTDGGSNWTQSYYDYKKDHNIIVKTGTSDYLTMGDPAFVMKTTDTGDTWTFPFSKIYEDIEGIDFATSLIGYAVADGDSSLKTTDGGVTWETVQLDDYMNDILAIDANTAIAVGNNGEAFKTTNGGESWTNNGISTSDDLYAIDKATDNVFYAVGTDTLVMKTSDAGDSWTKMTPPGTVEFNIYDASFINENFGVIVGGSSNEAQIFMTTDGGSQWSEISSPIEEQLNSIEFVNDSVGFICGADAVILKSVDSGKTWVQQSVTIPSDFSLDDFSEITMFDESSGLVAGDLGLVFTTTDGGTTWNYAENITREGLRDIGLVNGSAVISGYDGVMMKYEFGYEVSLAADFTADKTSGIAPLTVNFTDQSTGDVTSWSWDFDGDGNEDATTQNPSYEYTTAGTYTVTLTVGDGTDTDTKTRTDYITVESALEKPTSLTADLDETNGEVSLSWSYDGSSNTVFEDFSDGTADNWETVSGTWTVNNNVYEVTSNTSKYNSSYYNQDFTNFEVEVKMRKNSGTDYNSMNIYLLGDPTTTDSDKRWANAYVFSMGVAGASDRWSFGYQQGGTWNALQGWTSSTDINTGYGSYNVVKIVCNNGAFDIYINGSLQDSYTDQTFTSGKIGISMYDSDMAGNADFDYIKITPITAKESGAKATFQNFRIYRNGMSVGNTESQNYTDNLPDYGTYNYKVTAYYNEGESDSSNLAAVTWTEPSLAASFTADQTSGYAPLTVNFTDNSTGSISTWEWDFDNDGNVDATTQNPSHEYTEAGTYSVSLTVGDGTNTDTETKTDYITVSEPVVADFTADATSGDAPLTVNFTDNSTGNITTWEWDFDNDGNVDATTQNPSYEYTEAGTYTVALTVGDGTSTDTKTKTDYITVTETSDCDWDFASAAYEMNFEDTDDLSAWTIIDENSDGDTWVIATSGGIDASGCAGYSYNSTNAANDWLVSRCFNLEAGKDYQVNFYYKVEDSGFPEKLKVSFGTAVEASALTEMVVDLGEISNTSYEKSSSTISISTAGTYYFGWNVYSDANMWNLYIDSIKISEVEPEALAADFSASVTSGEAPLTVDFTDESSGNVSTWSWDFNGDGNEDATTQNPSYEYTEAGTYSVSLTVGDGNGTDTHTKTDFITVSEAASCDWNFAGSDFIMNFETTDDLTNWLYFDVNNDGKHWEVVSGSGINDSYCARYSYSEVNDADDWLISRCFSLEEGKSYKVEFQYAVEAESMPEKLKFAMGDAQAPSAMTEIIDDLGEITNEDYMKSEKIINVSTSGDYYFGWQAYSNANNWNVYIDSVKIGLTEETATSAETILAETSVRVYPNPSAGRFEVQFEEYGFTDRLEVLTVEGSRVLEIGEKEAVNRTLEINLSNMPAGIYFLKIYHNNKVITRKLIKQ